MIKNHALKPTSDNANRSFQKVHNSLAQLFLANQAGLICTPKIKHNVIFLVRNWSSACLHWRWGKGRIAAALPGVTLLCEFDWTSENARYSICSVEHGVRGCGVGTRACARCFFRLVRPHRYPLSGNSFKCFFPCSAEFRVFYSNKSNSFFSIDTKKAPCVTVSGRIIHSTLLF